MMQIQGWAHGKQSTFGCGAMAEDRSGAPVVVENLAVVLTPELNRPSRLKVLHC